MSRKCPVGMLKMACVRPTQLRAYIRAFDVAAVVRTGDGRAAVTRWPDNGCGVRDIGWTMPKAARAIAKHINAGGGSIIEAAAALGVPVTAHEALLARVQATWRASIPPSRRPRRMAISASSTVHTLPIGNRRGSQAACGGLSSCLRALAGGDLSSDCRRHGLSSGGGGSYSHYRSVGRVVPAGITLRGEDECWIADI